MAKKLHYQEFGDLWAEVFKKVHGNKIEFRTGNNLFLSMVKKVEKPIPNYIQFPKYRECVGYEITQATFIQIFLEYQKIYDDWWHEWTIANDLQKLICIVSEAFNRNKRAHNCTKRTAKFSAFDRKNDLLEQAFDYAEILQEKIEGFSWGKKYDAPRPGYPIVIYFQFGNEQVSFHSQDRNIPEFNGKWIGHEQEKCPTFAKFLKQHQDFKGSIVKNEFTIITKEEITRRIAESHVNPTAHEDMKAEEWQKEMDIVAAKEPPEENTSSIPVEVAKKPRKKDNQKLDNFFPELKTIECKHVNEEEPVKNVDDDNYHLILGDSRDLSIIPEGEFDLVIWDPMFKVKETQNDYKPIRAKNQKEEDKPVCPPPEEYDQWFTAWVKNSVARVKKTGWVIIKLDDFTVYEEWPILKENLRWENTIIWNKKAIGLGRRLRKTHENLVVLRPTDAKNSYFAGKNIIRTKQLKTIGFHGNSNGKAVSNVWTTTGLDDTVWDELGGNSGLFGNKRKRLHINETVIAIWERAIDVFVPLNGSILDLTMGSGSIGVSAKHKGRKYVGIEIAPKIFKKAQKNMEFTTECSSLDSYQIVQEESSSEDQLTEIIDGVVKDE